MNYGKIKLSKKLLIIVDIAVVLLFTSLGVILPNMLIPVAETNIYNYLSEPLKLMDSEIDRKLPSTEIAYLYVTGKKISASNNLTDVIAVNDLNELLKNIEDTYGKFVYKHRTYYYYTIKTNQLTKIALTNDNYINRAKGAILGATFPIVLITFY